MGKISRNRAYGVSSKYNFGGWDHVVYGPFETEDQAHEWLHTEERDFRSRLVYKRISALILKM